MHSGSAFERVRVGGALRVELEHGLAEATYWKTTEGFCI